MLETVINNVLSIKIFNNTLVIIIFKIKLLNYMNISLTLK